MDILKDLLAALSGVLNGLPQGLLALAFGFASVPTAMAFIVGALGNSVTGSVAVISFQAETITVAGSMGKNIRERLSMIFFGALVMFLIGAFGLLEKIMSWIGPVITNGMMAGVGIMLTKVAWDMAKDNKIPGTVSFATGLITYMATQDLVYTITVSVVLSSVVAYFTSKEEEKKVNKPFVNDKFQRLRFVINPMVIRGALAMVCLNIGANIAFGNINSSIAARDVNIDVLAMISSLADMASSFFGGGPVEVVISATASAPHPVWAGVLMMAIMAMILLFKFLPKIGKYIPTASIAGFLFVLGAIVTLPGNAEAALLEAEGSQTIVGAMTMVITAITDPFIGMLSGVIIEFLIRLFGF
ncbi:SulP family inorganic anion transporter [Gracilibacillus timonensis]|uniref:guanine permease n=1 Tax=Gracilibacillus timonensis TaxID=1816696 RepID=UPI0008252AEC|nr:guanine permease [Gracilibacillus timonensis]